MRVSSSLWTIVVAFMLFPVAVRAEESARCQKTLKIGVSLPLTAGAISSGEAVKNSIVLADEQFDTNNCVQFLFQDDQLLAKNALSVVNQFIDEEHVDGLIVYGTPTSIAVGNSVEAHDTPMIALSILGKVVEGKRFIMKHWCSAERLNDAVRTEVRRRGYRTVAVVSTQNDAMLGLRDLYLRDKVTEVDLDDEYIRDSADFRSSVLKIVSKKVDAVYVLLYPPQTGIFMKQLRDQGYRGEAFGVHNIEDPHEVDSSAGAMVGMWFANGDEAAGESYPERYRSRFGIAPALGGASGYDSAKMFIQAAGQTEDINSYLHSLKKFEGAFGRYNATPENDFDFGAVIKIVQKDGFQKISGDTR